MAGHRKRYRKEYKSVATIQRSTQHFEDRLARATGPVERLFVALGYLQAAIHRAAPGPGSAAAEEIGEKALAAARKLDSATTEAVLDRLLPSDPSPWWEAAARNQ